MTYLTITMHKKLQLTFILFFLSATILFAQETTKPVTVGLHAGMNIGMLDAGSGPSFSFHLGFRPEKIVQTEMAISYDSQKGEEFSSGEKYKSSALTIAAGVRLNIRPQKKWNPSLFLMPGIMMGSYETEDKNNYRSSSSLAAHLGISNTFSKKHMVTIGALSGTEFNGFYLKYGFLF